MSNQVFNDASAEPRDMEAGTLGRPESFSSAQENLSEHTAIANDSPAEENLEDEKAKPVMPPPSDFPDGGLRAWACVVGGWCAMFCTFGFVNNVGVFQNYYQTTFLLHYTPSTVGWIASLQLFLQFFTGFFVGRLYDAYGPAWLMRIGSFLVVFGLMMTSLSTQYYQLLLSQAVVFGVGAAMVFFPVINATATWFSKKRALAIGLTSVGSSIGGVIQPIMITNLIRLVGFPWTMRIIAFMFLGLLVIANLGIKSRLPPKGGSMPKVSEITEVFTDIDWCLLTLGYFLFVWGMFTPFTYIPDYGLYYGLSQTMSIYLVSILNAGSVFGRTLPAALGDRIGRFNVFTFMSFFSGIITLAMWIPAKSSAVIIAYSALFGFSSGAFVSLGPACIAQISDIRKLGLRVGLSFGVFAFAALTGVPIAGALLGDGSNWLHVQIWGGVTMLAGSSVMLFLRFKLAGFKLAVKV